MTSRHDSANEPRRISARRSRGVLAAALAAVCCVLVLAVLVGPAASRVAPVEGVGPAVEVAEGENAASAAGEATAENAADVGKPAAAVTGAAGDDANKPEAAGDSVADASEPERRWQDDVVLVRLSDDAETGVVNEALSRVRCLQDATVTADDIDLGFAELPLAEGYDVERALAELEGVPAIEGAQPNFIYHLADDGLGNEGAGTAASTGAGAAGTAGADTSALPSFLEQQTAIVAGTIATQSTPNDPYLSNQWTLESINAYDAWDVVKAGDAGDQRVTVAIVDNGCRMDHEDLASNIVDTYNAVTEASDVSPETSVSNYNHGTHVAGIVSATANNSLGVAGVSYNAGLLPIKVFKGKDATTTFIAKAYRYIRQHADALNIKVVNMSVGVTMGGPSEFTPEDFEEDDELTSAVADAYKAGILTVCSAGNDARNYSGEAYYNYPSDWLDCAISVIALQNGAPPSRADYSNYNIAGKKAKDLSAPGSAIYSTYAGTSSSYSNDSGTSMASPCVAGVAALVYAVNPDFTPAEVTDILCSTASTLGDDSDGDGWTDEYGHGEVDAHAAALKASNGSYITGKAELLVGGTAQLAISKSGSATWSSSDQSVATVDETGLVTGVSGGKATISAQLGDVTIRREVTVYDISFTGAASVAFGQMTPLTFNENPDTGLWYIDTENVAAASDSPGDEVGGSGSGDTGSNGGGSDGGDGADAGDGSGDDSTSSASAFFKNDLHAVATVGDSINVYGNRAGSARVTATLATNNDLVVRYPIEVAQRPITDATFTWPDTDFTYNGTAQELRPSKAALACTYGGTTYDYTLAEGVDYTVAFENAAGETVATPTAAGTYTVRVAGIGNFSGSFTREYTIARKQVTVTAVSASKGDLSDPDPTLLATIEGALDGDEDKIEYSIAVGESPSGETTEDTRVYPIVVSGDAVQVDGNYDVAFVNGVLVVGVIVLSGDPRVSVSCEGWIYDGSAHDPAVRLAYDSTPIPVGLYDVAAYQSGADGVEEAVDAVVDAGSYTVEVTPKETAPLTGSATGTCTVAPRAVSLVSESASRPYNGTSLTAPDVAVEGDGFADGEVSSLRATGTVTNVGSVENAIAYDEGDAFKASNYEITQTTGTLEVTPASLDSETDGATVSDVADAVFTGKAYKPTPAVAFGGATLVAGRDYELSYATADGSAIEGEGPVDVGAYKLTIVGDGVNCTGEISRTFSIAPAFIGNAKIAGISGATFTGAAHTPEPSLKYGSTALVAGADYTYAYKTSAGTSVEKPIAAGSYRVWITGVGNFTGSTVRTFTIAPASIAQASVSGVDSAAFTGAAHMPEPTVGVGSATLVNGRDYELSYTTATGAAVARPTAAGSYRLVVTAKGNYAGTIKRSFSITRAPIAQASVSSVAARAFTGKAYKPAPAVKFGSATLVAGRDYTLSYETAAGKAANPVKAGTYKLVITAKGNYTGTAERTFTISRAKQALKLKATKKTVKAKKVAKKAQKVKGALRVKGAKTALSYKIKKVSKKKYAKKFAVNKKGVITVKKGTPRGTYKLTVRVRAKATANYAAATKTKVVTIKVK